MSECMHFSPVPDKQFLKAISDRINIDRNIGILRVFFMIIGDQLVYSFTPTLTIGHELFDFD